MNINWNNIKDILIAVFITAGFGKLIWETFLKPFTEKLISHRFNSLLQREKSELDKELESKKIDLLKELEDKKSISKRIKKFRSIARNKVRRV